MRYRGFNITYTTDKGVERENPATHRKDIRNGYYCEIYPGDDDQYADRLDTFCLAEGYEISDLSDNEVKKAIRNYVDDNYHALKEADYNHQSLWRGVIIGRLIRYIGETLSYNNQDELDLYESLSDFCSMSDAEIGRAGFHALVQFFNRDDYAQTIAEYLIDDGTEHTRSGNYHIEFDEINELFGVDIPDDKEMLDKIVDALDRDIVSDVDISEDFDLMFYTDYCPNYEGETYEME